MPRSGGGVMSWPSGTDAVTGTTISGTNYNGFLADLLADLNAARPVVVGGTGATTAAAARTNLGLVIGTNVQAQSAVLDDLDTLGAPSADGQFLVATGAGAFAYESGGTARASLGLVIGTDVQAWDADLDTYAASPGALSLLDDVGTAHLATGFGAVCLQEVEVDAETSAVSCSTVIPYDDTVPQNTEGTEILSGAFTPKNTNSRIEVIVEYHIAGSNNVQTLAALFTGGSSAVATAAVYNDGASHTLNTVRFSHFIEPADHTTSAITLSCRIGGGSGITVNGSNGSRFLGGSLKSSIRAREWLTI